MLRADIREFVSIYIFLTFEQMIDKAREWEVKSQIEK